MKQGGVMTRTVRVAAPFDETQRALLTQTVRDYNQAWAMVVAWCSENQSVNRTRLQKAMYHPIREAFPQMPSQFVSMALRAGAGAVKSWNSNHPRHRWELRAERRKQSIPLDLRTMSLRGALLTVSTRVGQPRARVLVEVPTWWRERYPNADLRAATLRLDAPGGVAVNLIHTMPAPPERTGVVVGIDQGLYKIAVTSEGGEHSSKKTRAVRRKYQHNRAVSQRKGTRSAKRRLKAMSGREKRFMRDTNHQISKTLAQASDVGVYVLENLTGIRREHPGRDKQTRRWIGQWPFAQLQFDLEYKCQAVGIRVVRVDRAYTSQRCNQCGWTDRRNRRKARFSCRRCGHKANADHNAAANIRDAYLLSTHAGGAGRSQPPNDGWDASHKSYIRTREDQTPTSKPRR
jgi:IS605 OrfB family transposase